MQNFYCQFNSRGSHKRFSIENRLIFDTEETGGETLGDAAKRAAERDRLDQINVDLDSFDNLTALPENEDAMILHHLMSTVAKADGDLDAFYAGPSKEALGFFINDRGQYEIEGIDPVDAEGDNLAEYLKNLKGNITTAGFDEVGDEDIAAIMLATQVSTEAGLAQEHFTFLNENYDTIADLEEDVDKVQTLRKFAEVKHDYESGKETLLARSKVKEGMLSFEVRVDLVRRSAANATEAALLWYAVNHFPELTFDDTHLEAGKLNVYNIFNEEQIDQNGVAIVNGRLVVPYKPKDRELEDGLTYEYATYGYSVSDIDPALSRMRDPNNEFSDEGAEIADILEDGIEIYEGALDETRETIADFETNDAFQENYELLGAIASVPSDMFTNQVPAELLVGTPFESKEVKEGEEQTEWYFGHVDGVFFARTLHAFEKGKAYRFDQSEGWVETARVPERKYNLPTIVQLDKEGEKYEFNEEAAEMALALGLDPRNVIAHTLNTLHSETRRKKDKRKEIIGLFAEAKPGLQIPFPKLIDLEISLDPEKRADSITNIQLLLLQSYVEYFPGLNYSAVRWLAKDMGEEMYKLFEFHVGRQMGGIKENRVYKISTKGYVKNFSEVFEPGKIEKIEVENDFSEETKKRVEQIHGYLQDLLDKTVGRVARLVKKVGDKVGAQWGVGEILSGLFQEFVQMPLGDTWELSEEIALEWERLEKEAGTTLTFKEVVPKYAVEAVKLMKNPDTASRIAASSLLGKILGLMGYQNINGIMVAPATIAAAQAQAQAAQRPGQRPPQRPQGRAALDLTDKTEAGVFEDRLKKAKGQFGITKGKRLFTDEDVADIMEATAGDKEFTTQEANKAVLKQLRKRIAKTEDADEKAALKAEYDFIKSGKKPKAEREKDAERERRRREREAQEDDTETTETQTDIVKPLKKLTTDKVAQGKYEIQSDSGYMEINNGRLVFSRLEIPPRKKIILEFSKGEPITITKYNEVGILMEKNRGSDMKGPTELAIDKRVILGEPGSEYETEGTLKKIILHNGIKIVNPELHSE